MNENEKKKTVTLWMITMQSGQMLVTDDLSYRKLDELESGSPKFEKLVVWHSFLHAGDEKLANRIYINTDAIESIEEIGEQNLDEIKDRLDL